MFLLNLNGSFATMILRGLFRVDFLLLKHNLGRLGAILLLITFVLGYFNSEISHLFHHAHHEAELHTEEAESDPCHRAIYHGASHSCDHPTHLIPKEHDCELCNVVFQIDEPAESVFVNDVLEIATSLPFKLIQNPLLRQQRVDRSRAPPLFS